MNDGVYSSTQASRGEALFTSICTTCHNTERFTGAEFVSAWSGKPLAELFKAVQTMPEDASAEPVATQTASPESADQRQLHLSDELVTRANQTSARVRMIEDPELLRPYGGVGATLRFRI